MNPDAFEFVPSFGNNEPTDPIIDKELQEELTRIQLEESTTGENQQEEVKAHDEREHLNVVFIGHVDAGKSTLAGQILLLTGMVDPRVIEKYEREAREMNRDSWFIAYIMDTNDEERMKGKTVEVGIAHFETVKKRYTIMDAPGHKGYVPNMITGAAQADIGMLVISARAGEFEAGFDRGGQTREHTMLAKTLGVSRIIVVVNKMDDPTVLWSKERYDAIKEQVSPFLKQCGYKKAVKFIPVSGYTGANMKDRVSPTVCSWYDGPALIEALDSLKKVSRDIEGPVRLPVLGRYREKGLIVMGKLESGIIQKNSQLCVCPTLQNIEISSLFVEDSEVPAVMAGENVRLVVRGLEEGHILPGYVICERDDPCPRSRTFFAKVEIADLLPHKPLFSKGYLAVLHVHTVVVECEVSGIIRELDRKSGKPFKKKNIAFLRSNSLAIIKVTTESEICIETYENRPELGRFTLRDEGKTIAIGMIMKVGE